MFNVAAMLPMGVIGPAQIILIVVLVIVLFGGKKIPELMRGMGRGMKEFKDAVNKDYSAEEYNLDNTNTNTNTNNQPSQSKIETTKSDEAAK